jgi:hypothetical protein
MYCPFWVDCYAHARALHLPCECLLFALRLLGYDHTCAVVHVAAHFADAGACLLATAAAAARSPLPAEEEMETGRASPRKILRLQMQRKRQATMNGGSSAHNTAAKNERGVSFYIPPDADEVDPETLFEASDLQALCSPRDVLDVSALKCVKLDFDDLKMYDEA